MYSVFHSGGRSLLQPNATCIVVPQPSNRANNVSASFTVFARFAVYIRLVDSAEIARVVMLVPPSEYPDHSSTLVCWYSAGGTVACSGLKVAVIIAHSVELTVVCANVFVNAGTGGHRTRSGITSTPRPGAGPYGVIGSEVGNEIGVEECIVEG
ncbi:unnamed protein product [Phytophthora fragariaefolia]|uniref:Unnamed protein product n=1 Tax=Phytophthora fragariaefolia TaxID=1490495 RepID=A0A9W6UD02_9STRA|nr:unnamed protein product [Phytophthora fragariaefolia]